MSSFEKFIPYCLSLVLYVHYSFFMISARWRVAESPRPRPFKPNRPRIFRQQFMSFEKKNAFRHGAPGSQFMCASYNIKRGPATSSLSPLYAGPYKVIERGQKYFRLDVGGRSEAVSIDRLKPHLGGSPLQPAQPPRRGRPPAADFSAAAGVGGRGCPPE